jgi:hypothetical protein
MATFGPTGGRAEARIAIWTEKGDAAHFKQRPSSQKQAASRFPAPLFRLARFS